MTGRAGILQSMFVKGFEPEIGAPNGDDESR